VYIFVEILYNPCSECGLLEFTVRIDNG
jgi:hypothetical protein